MGPGCGGVSAASTTTDTTAVTQSSYSNAELEPIPAPATTNTASVANAVNALIAQIIDAKEAEQKEALFDMLNDAQSSALDIVPNETDRPVEKTQNGSEAGQSRDKNGETTENPLPGANASIQDMQSAAAMQAQAAANSHVFISQNTINNVPAPAEDAVEVIAAAVSI